MNIRCRVGENSNYTTLNLIYVYANMIPYLDVICNTPGRAFVLWLYELLNSGSAAVDEMPL